MSSCVLMLACVRLHSVLAIADVGACPRYYYYYYYYYNNNNYYYYYYYYHHF